MSKKSTTETAPSKFAQPFIQSGANALQGAYQGNQGNISRISDYLQNNMGNVANMTLNNPGLQQASAYNSDVLSGKYLGGNPHLQSIIDTTSSDVANRVNGAIGMRGGAGGSAQAQILSRELAKNESALRYQDYSTERGYQNGAVGQATALSGANNNNIQSLLQYLTGQATIPQSGASSYAQSLGGLLGGYTTTTQSDSFAKNLQNVLQAAAAAAAKSQGAG